METCDLIKKAETSVRAAIKKQARLQLRIRELESFIEETVQRSEKISYFVTVLLNSSGNVSLDHNASSSTPPSSPAPETSDAKGRSVRTDQPALLDEIEGFSSELLDDDNDRSTSDNDGDSETASDSRSRLNSEVQESEQQDHALDDSQDTDRESTDQTSPSPLYLRRFRKKLLSSGSSKQNTEQSSSSDATPNGKDPSVAKGNADEGTKVPTKGSGSFISSFFRSISSPFSKTDPIEKSGVASKGRNSIAPIGVGDERARQKALMSRILFFSKQSSKCQVNTRSIRKGNKTVDQLFLESSSNFQLFPQNDIIDANRRLVDLKLVLSKADKGAQSAFISVEDANTQKKSLCEQLQLLGQTANRFVIIIILPAHSALKSSMPYH